jgi:hypothetical protein
MSKENTPIIKYTDLDVEVIYDYAAGNGRIWQFGKLRSPVPGFEHETHALRIKTPIKDVTFLLCHNDAGLLGMIAYVLNGDQPVNERWIKARLQENKHLGNLHERAAIEGIDPETGYKLDILPSGSIPARFDLECGHYQETGDWPKDYPSVFPCSQCAQHLNCPVKRYLNQR